MNDIPDAVHTRNDVPTPFGPPTASPDARTAAIAVVIPADAAHVQTPEVIT